MKSQAILLVAAMSLTACGASDQNKQSDVAAEKAAPAASVAPQSRASKAANPRAPIGQVRAMRSPVVAPQSGASEAAKAAGAEPRKSIIPIIRGVPAGGATTAAKSPGAEPRKSIAPVVRDVPAGGVTTARNATTATSDLPLGVPYASDTDPIRIVSFAMSATTFHPGDNVTGDVVTTSNAASVTAQVGTIRVAVPRVAPGKFHLNLQLPSIPLPPGSAQLVISAIRKDGSTVTRSVPITVEL